MCHGFKVLLQRDVAAVSASSQNAAEVPLSLNKKDNTVFVGQRESNSTSPQKKDDPVPATIQNVKDSEQSSTNCPAVKTLHKSSDSEHGTFTRENTVISVKENTAFLSTKLKSSASATGPQPAPHGAVRTERESKPPEVKPPSVAAPLSLGKVSPNSKQRHLSKESALSTANVQITHDAKRKEASLPSAGADVKREEPAQLTHSSTAADTKQRETQPKSSVTTTAAVGKENTDLKPKPVPQKTIPSSSNPKTSPAPAQFVKQSLDFKHKDPSPKKQAPVVKDHHDSKPKDVHSPHAAPPQLRPLSDVSSQPHPPPVLPKPAVKKETPSPSSGAASSRLSTCSAQETVAKISKADALKPDSHKGLDSRTATPDKLASSGRKEPADRKKKETVQDVASAQKNTKRDPSRAALAAQKDSSDKDGGRCKQQKESPRSSGNKK